MEDYDDEELYNLFKSNLDNVPKLFLPKIILISNTDRMIIQFMQSVGLTNPEILELLEEIEKEEIEESTKPI